MNLDASIAVAPRLVWLDSAGSTNTELAAAASGSEAADWPDVSVIATDDQTDGRGRLGRVWSAPAGGCLAVSVLLRPSAVLDAPLPLESFGWLPLLAGAAMARTVGSLLPAGAAPVGVKWPNDVLIGTAKVCGILSELLPDGRGVVVGAGVNLFLTTGQLPVPTATSLRLAGANGALTVDVALSTYLTEFGVLYRAFIAHGGDAVASGLQAAVVGACSTLGREVTVELPTGEMVEGTATSLDPAGRLVVTRASDASTLVVSAGDVTHLRY